MAMHHGADGGHVDGRTSSTGLPRRGQAGTSSHGGHGAARAVRGLMAGALVAGPLAVLTALPARADAARGSLFDRPVKVHVNIGGVLDQPPALDLDRLGQVAASLANNMPPVQATTAGSGSGTDSGAGAGSGSSAGSGGAAGGGAGSGGGATQPNGPAAPADAGVAAGQSPPVALPPDQAGASAGPSADVPARADATRASSTTTPTADAAADGTAGSAARAIAHGSLLSASDSSAIASLNVLAVLLAGAGLVGIPATSLLTRRRA